MSNFKLTDSKEQISIDAAKTLIINLKVLGILNKESKLISRGKFLVIDPITWYQPVLRKFYHNDGRSFTYDKISSIMKELYYLLDKNESYKYLKLSSKKEMFEYLLPILNDAKNGLVHLKDTYTEDKTFVSQLDVEICNLEMIIKNIHNEIYDNQDTLQPLTQPISIAQQTIQSNTQPNTHPIGIPFNNMIPETPMNFTPMSNNSNIPMSLPSSTPINIPNISEQISDQNLEKLDLNDNWE